MEKNKKQQEIINKIIQNLKGLSVQESIDLLRVSIDQIKENTKV